MRMPASKTRKRFRRIPTVSPVQPKVETRRTPKSSPNLTWKDMGRKNLETAAKDWLEGKTVPEILSEAQKLAERLPQPKGFTGINLQRPANRNVVVEGAANAAITNSASMFCYRKPRKSSGTDIVKYCMKTLATHDITSNENAQHVFDINILDAEPVYDNPDSNEKYSNLTIRHAFDKHLKSQFKGNTDAGNDQDVVAAIEQSSLHFKSLTMDLVITNRESSALFVDIYELVPQHTLGPTNYNSSTEVATGYMSPRWTFEQGLSTTDVIEMQDPLGSTSVAANPYNSTVFSRTWKEVKHVRVNMTGNSVHRHKSAYSINKTVSYQEMAQFSTSGGKFPGWNPTFLVIAKGAPVAGKSAGATALSYTANMQLNYEGNPTRQSKVIVFDDKR